MSYFHIDEAGEHPGYALNFRDTVTLPLSPALERPVSLCCTAKAIIYNVEP